MSAKGAKQLRLKLQERLSRQVELLAERRSWSPKERKAARQQVRYLTGVTKEVPAFPDLNHITKMVRARFVSMCYDARQHNLFAVQQTSWYRKARHAHRLRERGKSRNQNKQKG